jgi:hypothetical protein
MNCRWDAARPDSRRLHQAHRRSGDSRCRPDCRLDFHSAARLIPVDGIADDSADALLARAVAGTAAPRRRVAHRKTAAPTQAARLATAEAR